MQSCGQDHRELQSPDGQRRGRGGKKGTKNRVSKAGGNFSVGLRGHQRLAEASRLEGNIHLVPFISCSSLCLSNLAAVLSPQTSGKCKGLNVWGLPEREGWPGPSPEAAES